MHNVLRLTYCLGSATRVALQNHKRYSTFVHFTSLENHQSCPFLYRRILLSPFNSGSFKYTTFNMPPKRGRPPKRGSKTKAGSSKVVEQETAVKPKASKKTKRSEDEDSNDAPIAKKSKLEEKKAPMNQTESNLDNIDFDCKKLNAKGDEYNLKICSWNVSGVRACLKKNGFEYLAKEDADIIALQETKCDKDKLPDEVKLPGYHEYFVESKKPGYCGVALYTKQKPLDITYGLNHSQHDEEGRMITAEFEHYYIVSVYVPNAGQKLVTLPKRLKWNKDFKDFIENLDKKKPVIVCGDMNVAHKEIDLTNPKTNMKNAGFTKEEREGMTEFLEAGFVDTFRQLYPDKTGAYTFWAYFGNARSKNIGWRIDYFIVSKSIKDNVCDNVIRDQVYGSDHCPIVLYMNL